MAVALREASTDNFRDYIHRVKANAARLADGLIRKGYRIITGGTENHLILWDVRSTTGLSGTKIEKLMEYCDN